MTALINTWIGNLQCLFNYFQVKNFRGKNFLLFLCEIKINFGVLHNFQIYISCFLYVGVQIGGACHNSSDCITDRAICYDGVCDCPKSYVHLRLSENGYDVCREMSMFQANAYILKLIKWNVNAFGNQPIVFRDLWTNSSIEPGKLNFQYLDNQHNSTIFSS